MYPGMCPSAEGPVVIVHGCGVFVVVVGIGHWLVGWVLCCFVHWSVGWRSKTKAPANRPNDCRSLSFPHARTEEDAPDDLHDDARLVQVLAAQREEAGHGDDDDRLSCVCVVSVDRRG